MNNGDVHAISVLLTAVKAVKKLKIEQFFKNSSANIISIVSNTIISLLLTPYLIRVVGPAAYALIPLSMVLMEYVNFINNSINAAISRFISIHLHKNENENVLVVLNSSLFTIGILASIQLIVVALVLPNLERLLNVPYEYIEDAKVLFILISISFVVSALTSALGSILYAKNKLNIIQAANISRMYVRALVIILLFSINEPNIKYVGYASLLASGISFLMTVFYCKRLLPYLKLSIRYINIKKIKPLFSMSGWVLVNQIGFLLFTKIDLLFVTKFISLKEAGIFSALLQLTLLVRTIAGMLGNMSGPIIVKQYALKNKENIIKIVIFYMKYIGFLLSFIVSFFIVRSDEILYLWLGTEYTEYSYLFPYLFFPLLVTLPAIPIMASNTAFNKVKVPAIFTLFSGVLLFPCYFIISILSTFTIEKMLLVGAGLLIMKNCILLPVYSIKHLNINYNKYTLCYAHILTIFMITTLMSITLKYYIKLDSIINILSVIFIYIILAAFMFYISFYRTMDKNIFHNLIKG
ncbi:oligosaccharide flippase family protein [Proteus terrae]|uniref:oligosaccharide flippase family protein n=1 Tax=Proteus terrae TaxID=1574161 RepID=UPI0038A08895